MKLGLRLAKDVDNAHTLLLSGNQISNSDDTATITTPHTLLPYAPWQLAQVILEPLGETVPSPCSPRKP